METRKYRRLLLSFSYLLPLREKEKERDRRLILFLRVYRLQTHAAFIWTGLLSRYAKAQKNSVRKKTKEQISGLLFPPILFSPPFFVSRKAKRKVKGDENNGGNLWFLVFLGLLSLFLCPFLLEKDGERKRGETGQETETK